MKKEYLPFEDWSMYVRYDGPSSAITLKEDDVFIPHNSHHYFLATYSPLTFLNQDMAPEEYQQVMKGYFDHDDDDFPYEFILHSEKKFKNVRVHAQVPSMRNPKLLFPSFSETYQLHKKALSRDTALFENAMLYLAQRQDRFKSAIARVWEYKEVDVSMTLDTYLGTVLEKQIALFEHGEYAEAKKICETLKTETKLNMAPHFLWLRAFQAYRLGITDTDTIVSKTKDLFDVEVTESKEFMNYYMKQYQLEVLDGRY